LSADNDMAEAERGATQNWQTALNIAGERRGRERLAVDKESEVGHDDHPAIEDFSRNRPLACLWAIRINQ
jgi:hypothetical protein